MTLMQRLIEVETSGDEAIKLKYGTSAANVTKVMKALLVDELLEQRAEQEEKLAARTAVERPPRNRKERKEQPEPSIG